MVCEDSLQTHGSSMKQCIMAQCGKCLQMRRQANSLSVGFQNLYLANACRLASWNITVKIKLKSILDHLEGTVSKHLDLSAYQELVMMQTHLM